APAQHPWRRRARNRRASRRLRRRHQDPSGARRGPERARHAGGPSVAFRARHAARPACRCDRGSRGGVQIAMMFLLVVTILSMLIAVVMSVIAWRLAGEERRRSEARV